MATGRLTESELRAWQALLHAHHDVVGTLDRELRERHGLGFSEYDVLLRLARAPERALRMSELSERVLMSPSGLTRLVDRLVARGLVQRLNQPGDARVALAALTEQGLAELREASATHLRGIRQHFTGKLSESQLRNVATGLEAVAGPHHVHNSSPPHGPGYGSSMDLLRLADRSWPFLDRAMRAHAAVYRATNGRVGHRVPGLPPMLLLDHVGAKSGTTRTAALVYVRDGEDLVIVASKGGYPKHPAWFHNLKANPDVVVQVGPERRPVRARVATPEERRRLWPRAVEVWPGYRAYQERTEREIPLVILEPRPD